MDKNFTMPKYMYLVLQGYLFRLEYLLPGKDSDLILIVMYMYMYGKHPGNLHDKKHLDTFLPNIATHVLELHVA